MVIQILDEERTPSFSEKLLGGLGKAATYGAQAIPELLMGKRKQQASDDFYERITGKDVSGASPQEREILLESFLKEQGKEQKQDVNQRNFQIANQSLQTMKGLLDEEGIGLISRGPLTGKGRQNRGKFKALQSGILPIFKSFFPRGFTEKEFKNIMKEWIPSTRDTKETAAGKIEGLENILGSLMNGDTSALEALQQGPGSMEESETVMMIAPNGEQVEMKSEMIEEALQRGWQQA